MLKQARQRTAQFQFRIEAAGIDVAVIIDENSIAYLTSFWGYLSEELGRPTMLVVRPDEPPIVITPLMESEMVSAVTWVEKIRPWQDAGACWWETVLAGAQGPSPGCIGVEKASLPAIVRTWLDDKMPGTLLGGVWRELGAMQMI